MLIIYRRVFQCNGEENPGRQPTGDKQRKTRTDLPSTLHPCTRSAPSHRPQQLAWRDTWPTKPRWFYWAPSSQATMYVGKYHRQCKERESNTRKAGLKDSPHSPATFPWWVTTTTDNKVGYDWLFFPFLCARQNGAGSWLSSIAKTVPLCPFWGWRWC